MHTSFINFKTLEGEIKMNLKTSLYEHFKIPTGGNHEYI